MQILFYDLEDESNPLSGSALAGDAEINDLLVKLTVRAPFVFELRGENGYMLQVGIAGLEGCVQHCPVSGDVPYMMAVGSGSDRGEIEFALGATPTPISRRYIVPFDLLRQIAIHFAQKGERSSMVRWEEI